MNCTMNKLPELSTTLSIIESVDSHPSRCESPLLPMGQGTWHQVDPDRLSSQLGKVSNRYSQQSISIKSYSIRDDDNTNEIDGTTYVAKKKGLSGHKAIKYAIKRPKVPRAKSYHMDVVSSSDISTNAAAVSQGSVRDLSSKFKSACRRFNPKRLTKSSLH
ncbi:hypothetical protein GGI12_002963 [Dipsacomyces acuminosporus]|nr:hypothetical protein GGI12_002963 [Dipsacomyces acuminosporus]